MRLVGYRHNPKLWDRFLNDPEYSARVMQWGADRSKTLAEMAQVVIWALADPVWESEE